MRGHSWQRNLRRAQIVVVFVVAADGRGELVEVALLLVEALAVASEHLADSLAAIKLWIVEAPAIIFVRVEGGLQHALVTAELYESLSVFQDTVFDHVELV